MGGEGGKEEKRSLAWTRSGGGSRHQLRVNVFIRTDRHVVALESRIGPIRMGGVDCPRHVRSIWARLHRAWAYDIMSIFVMSNWGRKSRGQILPFT